MQLLTKIFADKMYVYTGLSTLLTFFGAMAMGPTGIILAFWTFLLWYSVWQRPYRFELMLLATLGLLGAVAMLPPAIWENVGWLSAFMFVAAAPIVSLLIPTSRKSQGN